MASLREDMLVKIATMLSGATPAGTRVYRAPQLYSDQDVPPAIVIAPVSDDPASDQRGHYLTHTLTIRISVYARGAVADQAADATCIAIHAALMADETLDGHAIRLGPGNTTWAFDADDRDIVRVDMAYQALYSTRRSSLTERP